METVLLLQRCIQLTRSFDDNLKESTVKEQPDLGLAMKVELGRVVGV